MSVNKKNLGRFPYYFRYNLRIMQYQANIVINTARNIPGDPKVGIVYNKAPGDP